MEKIKQYLAAVHEANEKELLTKKGHYCGLTISRPVELLKSSPVSGIIKMSKMSVRAGVDYDNIKAVKEARESGALPKENAGLREGEWEIFPYVIKGKNGRRLRFTSNPNGKSTVQFFKDGKEISRAEALQYATAKEKTVKKSEERICFDVKEENVMEIN